MSKTGKSVASIALPIALAVFAPGIGTAIGGSILGAGAAGSATLGGAIIGGATGALTGGGVKGALLGAAGGALAPNLGDIATNTIGGTSVGDFFGVTSPADAAANAISAYGPIPSGASSSFSPGENALLDHAAAAANAPIGSVVSGGVARSLGANISPVTAGLSLANGLATANSADAAKEAAKIQASAVDKAVATQAPYNELGTNAAAQIQQIQADPGGYVQNNPFYKSLADDAQQRLLANQASKGKVASGGTADALQTSLLNLGNGLVQQQVGTLQNQVNSGQTAASNTSNLQTDKGAVQAGGVVGASNALQTGYQNQIATLLALQNLSKAPSYQPGAGIRA
jgi:hypothetical protein